MNNNSLLNLVKLNNSYNDSNVSNNSNIKIDHLNSMISEETTSDYTVSLLDKILGNELGGSSLNFIKGIAKDVAHSAASTVKKEGYEMGKSLASTVAKEALGNVAAATANSNDVISQSIGHLSQLHNTPDLIKKPVTENEIFIGIISISTEEYKEGDEMVNIKVPKKMLKHLKPLK